MAALDPRYGELDRLRRDQKASDKALRKSIEAARKGTITPSKGQAERRRLLSATNKRIKRYQQVLDDLYNEGL